MMRIHPSQLVPGCILTKEVMGKTKRPIIPKNTVIHSTHIHVLHKFNVSSVEVANKLTNGSAFTPEKNPEIPEEKVVEPEETVDSASFQDQYLEAVEQYKKWFRNWQSGAPIDINAVRTVMVPLLEQAVDLDREIFSLHHSSSAKEYPYHHSVAMGAISAYLASKMGYNYGEWIQIGLAGLLSDCGMAKIDKSLLLKEDSLTEAEFEEIKKHAAYSYRLVESIPSLSTNVKLAILQHHERLDGSGYPLGLQKEKLHSFGQLIALSDIYHAMTSERIYRQKQSPFKVLEELLQEQFGRYDHTMIQLLVKEMANLSTGSQVVLSNGQRAEVLFVESAHPTRPMVRTADDEEIILLKERIDLHIEEIVD
ncbi:HD-GYP domain-containing protein [Halobacillus salinarum]|uniref:HD-GYP domain-containing protein n=1 Tax=Halobacillus salinarum TaxID=2932257 RepID=A0ABY4ELJ3_9BACI|nr:HD-GYP domain-containing protein [Halobacillus salinarum]UOQ44733.1 HD-GYP domain-containing protein [Halobacillus salinarum]